MYLILRGGEEGVGYRAEGGIDATEHTCITHFLGFMNWLSEAGSFTRIQTCLSLNLSSALLYLSFQSVVGNSRLLGGYRFFTSPQLAYCHLSISEDAVATPQHSLFLFF